MKILTFNIRNALANDGANRWDRRREFVYDYLRQSNADVICLQEVVPVVKTELIVVMNDMYECVGEGRLAEPKEYDEINLIAYKRSVFNLLAKDHFWLSDTPSVAGSKYPTQEHWPRTCTNVTLKAESDTYHIFATHLDNVDMLAREKGLKLILSRATKCEKTIVCGDFNDTPDNVHKWIGENFVDLTDGLVGTYTEYGKTSLKIDYIIASRDIKQLSNSVCDIQIKDGLYISDHFSVLTELI